MKTFDVKEKFIQMRAEGKSLASIAKQLEMSQTTCKKWEKECKASIAEQRAAELDALYEQYHMTRRARIERMASKLQEIEKRLEEADYGKTDPARLLDVWLKYSQALKEENVGSGNGYIFEGNIEPQDIVNALGDLLNRVRAGEVTAEQANRESGILSNMLRAMEAHTLKERLEALESIIGGRCAS